MIKSYFLFISYICYQLSLSIFWIYRTYKILKNFSSLSWSVIEIHYFSVKTHPSDEVWTLIHQLFLKASSSDSSTEKGTSSVNLSFIDKKHRKKNFPVLFTEISNDAFEFIIGGLTKRFDNDDLLKTKLLLFCLRNADENKFNKLLVSLINFLCPSCFGNPSHYLFVTFLLGSSPFLTCRKFESDNIP